IVNARFHAIGKPTPKTRTDAWGTWQYCINSLGLISYIDKDVCIVNDSQGYYGEDNASNLIYGESILYFEENVDSDIADKGVVVQSFDPLTGRVLEAFFPPPGDERLKVKRGVVNRATKESRGITANEQS